ncbi:MAG: sigma 54-interacting transcriptional regulator [Tissierellaceae bacterium]|nr:sigma 54-interacting transcriptional regulator [Tissierellaceae bacterium]
MAFESEYYVKMFTDMMSEGFIVIDSQGKIKIYNDKAKEIFGIANTQRISHHKGKIEEGDIVIIADNSIGQDDGNLDGKSLEVLGVKNPKVKEGDALIAIGTYGAEGDFKPIIKFLRKGHKEEKLTVDETIMGMDIKVEIDFANRFITIWVEGVEYRMLYLNAIGHMVVLDGQSLEMKFYQAHGYTARGESVNDLLRGNTYMAKGEGTEILDVLGKDIFEIHKSDSMIQQFLNVAMGKDIIYIDQFEEINGIPTMCTLLPVEQGGRRIGAALKVEDISQIKKAISERDYAINKLEQAENLLLDEKVLNKAFPNFSGNSQQIDEIKRMALKASKTNSNVLILGESGTGKSILARGIHENSKYKDKPFIYVNCGAIPDNLLESELFGYEKGAFTGAHSQGKKGFFEIADGGTLFLDEIGDIPLSLQGKLLEAIQEKSFYRVGGIERIRVNIRIVSATNKNLEEEMLKGHFREELYYRINVFPIWIPPLRERKQDIIPLVDFLLPKICDELGTKNKRISSEAKNLLLRYDWPGNIRELENILERAVNLSEGNNILSRHIAIGNRGSEERQEHIIELKKYLEVQEKKAIEKALDYYGGNKRKAMEVLKISKTTFYEKLKKYGIK